MEITTLIDSKYLKGNLSNDFVSSILKNKPKKKIESELFLERPSVFIILLLIVILYTENYVAALFKLFIRKFNS